MLQKRYIFTLAVEAFERNEDVKYVNLSYFTIKPYNPYEVKSWLVLDRETSDWYQMK